MGCTPATAVTAALVDAPPQLQGRARPRNTSQLSSIKGERAEPQTHVAVESVRACSLRGKHKALSGLGLAAALETSHSAAAGDTRSATMRIDNRMALCIFLFLAVVFVLCVGPPPQLGGTVSDELLSWRAAGSRALAQCPTLRCSHAE